MFIVLETCLYFILYINIIHLSILEPKNGDCPEDPRPRNCSIIRPSECLLDGQCDWRRKYCKFGCRKFCVDAIDQHEVIVIKNDSN